ncbi:MAG TPA: nuclear transport factor 2 family protein [Roseiflexaceae bacterium]|nr:nuclear transport factor 2 family protein [Roseiflexaceae bacterium]
MTQQQTPAQRFIDALHALEQGDESQVEQITALFSEDVRLTNAALRLVGREHRGREGARIFWTEYRRSFREVRSEFFQITGNQEAAGLFWTSKGTDPEGEPFSYDGVSLLVFDGDGLIRMFRGYYDTREMSRSVPAE